MSKFNKSAIMKRAWVIAREMLDHCQNKSRNRRQYEGYTAIKFMWRALEQSWEEAKTAVKKAAIAATQSIKVKSNGKRQIMSLEKAQLLSLSHGKSWYPSEYQLETGAIHPQHQDELVCYVYA